MALTVVDQGLLSSTAQYTGFKNRIINGAMQIDQRNAGASVTPTITNTYTVDRWQAQLSVTSKYSVQQNAGSVTPPAGFTNYLGITSLSAYSVGSTDYFALRQHIEGFNAADFAWGTANASPITISFWVRSSLTGTFSGYLNNATDNYCYLFNYTINSANTWEQKTITIAGPTSGTWNTTNGQGIKVGFGLGTGSTLTSTAGSWQAGVYVQSTGSVSVVGTNGATFYITGVQLEKGSTATSFDYRPYGTELALCQRYYDENKGEIFGAPANGTTNIQWGGARFTVEMRTTPTVVLYGNGVANSVRSSGGSTVTLNSPSVGASTKGLGYVNVSSGLTNGTWYQAGYTASAEL